MHYWIRRCKRCDQTFSSATEKGMDTYFYWENTKDGLSSVCKKCKSQASSYVRIRDRKDPEMVKALQRVSSLKSQLLKANRDLLALKKKRREE